MPTHIAAIRLADLSRDDGPLFTVEEWQHFRHCVTCMERFRELAREQPKEEIGDARLKKAS
jgi:hypothetical protein